MVKLFFIIIIHCYIIITTTTNNDKAMINKLLSKHLPVDVTYIDISPVGRH